MEYQNFVLITDRGGHLHNAKMLIKQMQLSPNVILTTQGPEVKSLRENSQVLLMPYLFTWLGKFRFFNPIKALVNFVLGFWYALGLKPKFVLSFGATNVVFFCFWAWVFGAKVIHIECMNQVSTKSVTGKLLYPICYKLYVQWKELVEQYGPKAEYAGWVL